MRRFFLRANEIVPLIAGVARGQPVALRRVLGARRAGRVGVALGVAGLLLAVPGAAAPWFIAAQVALGFPGAAVSRPPLRWLEYERLSLWLAGAVLIGVAPVRLFSSHALAVAALAWLGAHLWLWRSLRRGLE